MEFEYITEYLKSMTPLIWHERKKTMDHWLFLIFWLPALPLAHSRLQCLGNQHMQVITSSEIIFIICASTNKQTH